MKTNELVKLILDYAHGKVENYSKDDAADVIRQALIAANGGSTKVSLKSFRRNPALYEVIEVLVDKISAEGVSQNDFFNEFAEIRNLGDEDSADFEVPADSILIVSDAARGAEGVRRQRIGESTVVNVKPTPHVIKVYDELTRVMSGKADINKLVDKISKAVEEQRLEDVFAAWNALTSNDLAFFESATVAGTYSEAELLDVVNKVEAKNGCKCYILATLVGARTIKATDGSDSSKESVYANGYARKWNGVDVHVIPQKLKIGTETFVFSNTKIYVIPVNVDKPIKQVLGGDTFLDVGTGVGNADLSVDIAMIVNWGTNVVVGSQFGVYDIGTAG